MHRACDASERRVAFEPEAREQHLEGHPAVDVRKLRPVEVEADRFLRPGARAVDPDEAGIAIDEAADQPGAGYAIHPEVLPRRPYAVLVGLSVERPEMPKRGARLTARILDAALEGGKRLGGLSLPIARQEIPRGKPLKRASQSFERAGGGGGSELFEQRSVVRAAVEQSAHLLELFRALRLQLDDHGRSASGVDLGLKPGQHLASRRALRQDVHAVTQHATTGFLERAPDANAQARVTRRQAENQSVEDHVMSITSS